MHNTDRTQQYMESGEMNSEFFSQGELPQEFAGEFNQEFPGEFAQEFQESAFAPEMSGMYEVGYQGEGGFAGELVNPMTGEVNAQAELGLAAELLSVGNEQELNQFLGGLVRHIGRSFKKVAGSGFGRMIGGALRSVAKAALPMVGGALGTLIPIPGVGTALGAAAANAAGDALGLEGEGMSSEDRQFEIARRIVRMGIESARALEHMPESEFMNEAELGSILSSVASSVLPALVDKFRSGQATSGAQATGGGTSDLSISGPFGLGLNWKAQGGGQVTGGTAVGINAPAPRVPFQPSPPSQVLPRPNGGPVARPHPPVVPNTGGHHHRWIRQGRHIIVLNVF